MLTAGTSKSSNGTNTTTIYSWNHSKKGLLRKAHEFEVISKWADEGFDVFIDIAYVECDGEKYTFATSTLYTSKVYLIQVTSHEITIGKTFDLRNCGIQTSFVKCDLGFIWVSGDDNVLNRIEVE